VRGKLPVTVVVAPPQAIETLYENSKKTLLAVEARVVTEEEFEGAAHEIAIEAAKLVV
jgi:hypothetical protein